MAWASSRAPGPTSRRPAAPPSSACAITCCASSSRRASSDWSCPSTTTAMEKATLDLVAANRQESCYLRHLAFIGSGSMGVDPGDNPVRLAIASWKWGAYLGEEGLRRGVRLVVSTHCPPVLRFVVRPRQGDGQLHHRRAGEARGGAARLRRLRDARRQRLCRRVQRRQPVHRPRRRHQDAAAAWDPARHHPRHGAVAGGASAAGRCSRCRSPATRCTPPTRSSSPAPPPR